MRKIRTIRRPKYSLSPDEMEWSKKEWRDYSVRFNGKEVYIKPNLLHTCVFLTLTPVRHYGVITSFDIQQEHDWFPMNQQELFLIHKYLTKHPNIKNETPMDNRLWEVVDTRILNRNSKIDFLLL